MITELAVNTLHKLPDPQADRLLTVFNFLKEHKEVGRVIVSSLEEMQQKDENPNPDLVKFTEAIKFITNS